MVDDAHVNLKRIFLFLNDSKMLKMGQKMDKLSWCTFWAWVAWRQNWGLRGLSNVSMFYYYVCVHGGPFVFNPSFSGPSQSLSSLYHTQSWFVCLMMMVMMTLSGSFWHLVAVTVIIKCPPILTSHNDTNLLTTIDSTTHIWLSIVILWFSLVSNDLSHVGSLLDSSKTKKFYG